MKYYPIDIVEGLPAIQSGWICCHELTPIDLRWAPHLNFFVTGAYSALQLGPDAFNLAGTKAGSERIVEAISVQGSHDNETDNQPDILVPQYDDKNIYSALDSNS